MSSLQLTIPAQDSKRPGAKVKPREVRQWLANLPYLDLQRAARAASQQLRLMNRQDIGGAARLEILGDFLGTYQRLADSLPANSADPLHSVLKRLRQDMSFGYKIVVHELVNKRRGFIGGRNLPLALLGAIYTLKLQFMQYYAGYNRIPRALWGECLALYGYARQIQREDFQANLPGVGQVRIDTTFRLLALLRLADPYSVAKGMVVVLDQYFAAHRHLSRIEYGQTSPRGGCLQLLEPQQGNDDDATQQREIVLNIDALMEKMAEDIRKLERYGQSQAIGLPAGIPAATLLHTLRQVRAHWQTHPRRQEGRYEVLTMIELVSGLDAAYQVMNAGYGFNPAAFADQEQEDVIELGTQPSADVIASQAAPEPLRCTSINRSSGGLAIRYRGEHMPHPRVGQLIALRRPGAKSSAWVIAACRWLAEAESASGFNLGLQYLAREPSAIVIRSLDSAGLGGDYQAAISAVQKRGQQRVYTLITRSGATRVGGEVAIYHSKGHYTVLCTELLESSWGFDRFIYEHQA